MVFAVIIIALIAVFILICLIEKSLLSYSFFLYDNKSRTCSKLRGKDISDSCFVVISDLHSMSFGRSNSRLISSILSVEPDAVIIAGDLIVGTMSEKNRVAVSFLKDLAKHVPVYYGMGNHETKAELFPSGMRYIEEISGIDNVYLLRNSSVIPECADYIRLYGFEQEVDFFKKNAVLPSTALADAFGSRDTERISIVIAHDSEQFESFIPFEADIILSGHLHGGIIRLPFIGGLVSPRYKFFPKYDAGLFKKGRTNMIVSRGLGNHAVPIRVFNWPEIVVLQIRK